MPVSQVELMCADTPVTIYPKTDKCKGGKGGKKDFEFSRLSSRSIDVARQRWENMKKAKERRDMGIKENLQFS